MLKRISFFLVGGAILILVIGGIVYWQGYQRPSESAIKEKVIGCLGDDEYVSYPTDERYAKEVKIPIVPMIVSVKDSSSHNTKYSFTINDFVQSSLAVHRCGIYVLRDFDKQSPNYREELWKYDYYGNGEKLFTIFTFLDNKPQGILYNGFVIDPDEKYIVLEKNYLGKDDYALIIKNLATLEDIFVLNLKNVLAEHPDIIPGSFGLGSWSRDGKHLYGDLFRGALSTAYYRIEAETWKTDIFVAPSDILAGVERAINFDNWRLAYVDIPTFTGVQEVYEQIIEKAKKEGKQKNLYVYNLRTKEKIKVASADPEWRFNINWLSGTELQYELPTGEKKIYKIPE